MLIQVLLYTSLTTLAHGQVNSERDSDQDLLATDSFKSERFLELDTEEDLLAVDTLSNEISHSIPILAPPRTFSRKGDRLVLPARKNVKPVLSNLRGKQFPAIVQQNQIFGDGGYQFNYATGDGQRREEVGKVSSGGSGSIVKTGGWEYRGSDGQLYKVQFVADELGFRPVGDHIHPAFVQAQRQARLLAGRGDERNGRAAERNLNGRNRNTEERARELKARSRNQNERTRTTGNTGRIRQQEDRVRSQDSRLREGRRSLSRT